MIAIDVQNIVKKFGDFTAVKGITFSVEAGRSSACWAQRREVHPDSHADDAPAAISADTAIVNGFDVVKQSDGVRHSISDPAGDDRDPG